MNTPSPQKDVIDSEETSSDSPTFVRRHKKQLIVSSVIGVLALLLIGLYAYLRPDTWHYYTDEISFRQLAKDVEPRLYAWEQSSEAEAMFNVPADAHESAVSPDGIHLVYTRGGKANDADLFVSRWDGKSWGEGKPLRALNSEFNESGPAFSSDGKFLYFASDRPGGPGGYDLWASRFDGIHFAWPLPLSKMVNSPFDDLGPSVSPDHNTLFFSSNRPHRELTEEESAMDVEALQDRHRFKDFDVFAADRIPAGVTNREVERAMSMLYYLREAALADELTMARLGGSRDSEAAVNKALKWLSASQETNGYWSISKHGGSGKHDMGATAFALLAFLGRGETHLSGTDYSVTVRKGLEWMTSKQDPLGDLRPGGANMYDHSIGALALAEAYGVTKDQDWIHEHAQAAVDFLVDSQNETTGGWRYNPGQEGDLSVSGWAIMALKSAELSGLNVPEKTFEGIRRFLKSVSHGKDAGLYGYTPGDKGRRRAMIATGYFCSQLMGLSPNTLSSLETSSFLKKDGVHSSDLYYAYYGTLSAYQGQGPLWQEWKKKLHESFLKNQGSDGAWSPQDNDGHGKKMGKVVTTALVTLSLQAHYRYTPFYGLGYDPDPDPSTWSTLNLDDLPEMPLYRRAKYKRAFSSRSDDIDISLSDHGDFLYLASDRKGGYGGYDIYRYRISGDTPSQAQHLGKAINTEADEVSPDTRMAGMNLVFSSNQNAEKPTDFHLKTVMTRQVYQHHAYAGIPSLSYMMENFRNRLLLLIASVILFGWLLQLCLKKKTVQRSPEEIAAALEVGSTEADKDD